MWHEGYTSEIDYVSGYDAELSPTRIRLALLSCGIEHSISADPAYLELGFGQGLTLNVHAATGSGRYWGTDFNPAQVANARELADAMGKPITLLEDSFEEMAARDDLPQFDIIAMHGIWSWVSDGARKALVEIVRKSLKPGGALYISYNVTPGWSPAWPLRTLLSEYARREGSGPALNRIEESIRFAEQVIGVDAAYFRQNPQVAQRLEQIKKADRRYLAHEYFNANWQPMAFAEVADQLAEAKLGFAASAWLMDNVAWLSVPPAAEGLLKAIKDPVMRQTTLDYLSNNQFRRDIFLKGGRTMPVRERNRRIEDMRFMLTGEVENCPSAVQSRLGDFALRVDVYKAVAEELASRPDRSATIGELMQAEATRPIARAQLWDILLVLTAVNFVSPISVSTTPEQDEAASRALNLALLERAESGIGAEFLAAPRLGIAIASSRIEQMLLRAMLNGVKDPAGEVLESLQEQDQYLIIEGAEVIEPDAMLKELQRIHALLETSRFALLKRAGVC